MSSVDARCDRSRAMVNSVREIITIKALDTFESPITEPELPSLPEWDQLYATLRKIPHDEEKWVQLLRIAERSGDARRIRHSYDSLLRVYPDAVFAKIQYIRSFSGPSQHQSREALFKRFLNTSYDVELWQIYLSHVKCVYAESYDAVCLAFELAIEHVGHDQKSGEVWEEYIRFVESSQTRTTSSDSQQLRRLYQRATQTPLENAAHLWCKYELFENQSGHKENLEELSPAYNRACSAQLALEKHFADIASMSPTPKLPLNLPHHPTFGKADRVLVGFWKTYLRWEESNPLKLGESQRAILLERIRRAYCKALARTRYFPEIWYMAYTWLSSIDQMPQAMTLLKDGIVANPTSFVLNLAYAEVLEAAGKDNGPIVHGVYATFLERLRADLAGRGDVSMPHKGGQGCSDVVDALAADTRDPGFEDFSERRREYGVVWVMYMRFARRTEGSMGSQRVLSQASKDTLIPWQVYEAAARNEYHCSREVAAAVSIYEKGLGRFRGEAGYVLQYLDFLLSVNDMRNAGALFFGVIATFPSEPARPLWERWAQHQNQYGDLQSVLELEKRMSAIYTKDTSVTRFSRRYVYDGIDTIATRDLGFAHDPQYKQPTTVAVEEASHTKGRESHQYFTVRGTSHSHASTVYHERSNRDRKRKRERSSSPPRTVPPRARRR